jgi:hypothetical protein
MTRAKWTASTLILPILCLAALTLAAEPYREDFDQTYDITADGRVALENVNGDVLVGVWDRNVVRVQATKEADSREDLEKLRIEVDSTPSGVRIVTRMPERDSFFGHRHHERLSVEYTLTVPRGASLDRIDLVNGNLTVSGVAGLVKAELVNGDVKATALTGSVDLDTVNGTVELELDKVGSGQRLTLESVNGSVELRLPASASADVQAETVNGGISNDFGLEVRKHEYVGKDLSGTIGGGGADIRLETVNGRIRLLKK